MELVRLPEADASKEPQEPRALNLRGARLGLTAVERKAVEELLKGGVPGANADFVAQRAAALAQDAEGAVRRRSLAKAAAVQEAILSQLTALLGAAVVQRDEAAVKLLDRAVTGAANRFSRLMEELRAESLGGRRAVVQVGVVGGTVNIAGNP